MLGLFSWGTGAGLYGQSGIFDRTGIIPGHSSYGSLTEENIDLFTGNVTLRYRDIYLPGPNGLDLEVWRVYNSKILKDRQSGNPVVQAYHKSWVGLGWTMHMGMVHNYSSSTPVIEFPDGRLETAFPNMYNLGSNVCLTRDFLKYDKTTLPPLVYPRLYFKNGVIWTFEATATLTRADGTSDPVRLVTKIENPFGHSINIHYFAGTPCINYIDDSMGRRITFISSGNPRKLSQIKMADWGGNDRTFNYSVGNWDSTGYYRLDSFTPPMLPATTFAYNDGSSSQYELIRLTTSYGGVLEYSYQNHDFYFNTICLDSRVASEKRIWFNAGDPEPAVWNFTYPSYNGMTTGTIHVDGPVYDEDVTYNAYDAGSPWKIGLIEGLQMGDSSYSEEYQWTCQQISYTNWWILGVDMGDARGPLVSTVTKEPQGDASSKLEYLYETAEPKKYGLHSTVKTYINGGGTLKNTNYLNYFFENHIGFKNRYMLEFVWQDWVMSPQSQVMRSSFISYYEETGKWGALKQVQRYKTPGYYVWDYGYGCTEPTVVTISIDPPGQMGVQYESYVYGVKDSETKPDYVRLERLINPFDSCINSEKFRDEGIYVYDYDNCGRIIRKAPLEGGWDPITYDWPYGENRTVITQGPNVVTKFWDGMGRDMGYTESGDGITLYFLRTLDAEGRLIAENKGSTDEDHAYRYEYNAAGQLVSITDPESKPTTITYGPTSPTKTVTDAELHSTVYEYGDLPGLPTRVTDALGNSAFYTYDAVGRLTEAQLGTRHHTYSYDGVDNVKSETHPETGNITYEYNLENLLYKKIWAGTEIEFIYDSSGRPRTTRSLGSWVEYGYSDLNGRLQSASDLTTGWRREGITYNPFGRLTEEWVTIPGLPKKRINYTYDERLNLSGTILDGEGFMYPLNGTETKIVNNGLNMPETLSFRKNAGTGYDQLVSDVDYGPNKLPTSVQFTRNGTSYTAGYNNAGMLDSATLTGGAGTLYHASYHYDDVGNIREIACTAPALTASFGYDPLNRLTSANYSTGVGAYSYEYDAHGNMLRVIHNGSTTVFEKTYDAKNQIEDFEYDSRGNLISTPTMLYYWDAQNRLRYVQNTAGEVLGKYLYDDRGLRLSALPQLPEIHLKHDDLDLPDESEVYLRAAPGNSVNETLTILNLGDANLNLGALSITGDVGDFEVVQNPQSPVLPLLTTDFVIQFHPQSAGHKIAGLTIPSNDVDEGVYHLNLYGNYEPEIEIFESPDGGSVDYGEVGTGYSSTMAFAIENRGDKELVLNPLPLNITGPDADQFSFTLQPVSPVLGGQNTPFAIRFSPTSEGLKMAAISIGNNDWDENPYDITLYGTGIIGPMKIDEETAFEVTSPLENEILAPGSAHLVSWTGAEAVENVKIEYSMDNGSTYLAIAERTPNTGEFTWLVPDMVSGLCLVRISNADGPPRAPKAFVYEMKLKIPSDNDDRQIPVFKLLASIPDPVTRSNWTAELVLAADSLRDSAGAALNSATGDFGPLSEFLGRWHQARIQMEFGTYTASVSLNGRIILDRVPLRQEFGTLLPPEIRVSAGPSAASSLRVEDIRLSYCDRLLKPQNEGEEVSQSILIDPFEAYQVGEFPKEGGWLPEEEKGTTLPANETTSLADRTGLGTSVATAARIDDGDSFSGSKSFMLEMTGEAGVSVSKKFSLPDRLPFGVSDGNFKIGLSTGDIGYQVLAGQEFRAGDRRSDSRSRRGYDVEGNPRSRRKAPGQAAKEGSFKPRQPSLATSKIAAGGKALALTLSGPRAGNFYLYSFDGRLLRQYDVYGATLKDFIYIGNRLIAEYDAVGNRYLYYTQDQINSTRIVTDDSGTVVHSQAYNPYGGVQETWANSFDPLAKFSGKERDVESELDYLGARYYDRGQYRFISVDPKINFQETWNDLQRLNLYAYCGNKPISFVDPDGLSYLEYNHIEGKIRLYSSTGELRGTFPAANNCSSNPYPEGSHDFLYHSNNWLSYWPGIDNKGSFVFDVEGHTGMGVHAHEENTIVIHYPDGNYEAKGGLTYKDKTEGCISTTHEAMEAITQLHASDPLTHLDVARGDPIMPECMTTGLPLPSSTVTVIVPAALPAARQIDIRPPG